MIKCGDMILVNSVETLPEYKLLVVFNTGEKKIFDFSKYLDFPVFKKLKNPLLFKKAFIEGHTVVWDEYTDIAPERLYSDGILV